MVPPEQVALYVGADKVKFLVAKKLLMKNAWFARMLTGNFVEAINQTINLETDEPETFELFRSYLNGEILRVPGSMIFGEDEEVIGRDDEIISFKSLIRLYYFADLVLDFKLKDSLMNSLVKLTMEIATIDIDITAQDIVDAFSSGSDGLTRLLCDISKDIYEFEDRSAIADAVASYDDAQIRGHLFLLDEMPNTSSNFWETEKGELAEMEAQSRRERKKLPGFHTRLLENRFMYRPRKKEIKFARLPGIQRATEPAHYLEHFAPEALEPLKFANIFPKYYAGSTFARFSTSVTGSESVEPT